MAAAYPDAQEWARQHSLANVPRLARLEGFAFQRHPEVVASFGADGEALAQRLGRRAPGGARSALGAALVMLGVVGLLSPLAGVAFFLAGTELVSLADPFPARVAFPAAGISFAVAAVMQMVLFAMWRRTGALWAPGVVWVGLITVALAALALLVAPLVAARDSYAGGAIWMLLIAAAAVLGLLVAGAVLLRRGHRGVEVDDSRAAATPTVTDRERARLLAAALEPSERAAIKADRDAAIEILLERGLLDADERERALTADLGTLFTLDPIRRD